MLSSQQTAIQFGDRWITVIDNGKTEHASANSSIIALDLSVKGTFRIFIPRDVDNS
jgi:hypothetical protein